MRVPILHLLRKKLPAVAATGGLFLGAPGLAMARGAAANKGPAITSSGMRITPNENLPWDMNVKAAATPPLATPFTNKPNEPVSLRLDQPIIHPGTENAFESLDADYVPNQGRMKTLTTALEQGRWSAQSLHDPEEAVHLALAAHRQGRFSLGQLATVVLLWEFLDQSKADLTDINVLQLLNQKGELTKKASGVFFDSKSTGGLKLVSLSQSQKSDPALRKAHFQTSLQKVPCSERVAFALPRQAFDLKVSDSHRQITYLGSDIVLPSFSVLQAMLKTRGGEDAITLLPAFGQVGKDKIPELKETMRRGARVFGLDFPGLPFPPPVHGNIKGRFARSVHDFDHAMEGSLVPAANRILVFHLLDIGMEYQNKVKDGQPPLKVLGGNAQVLVEDAYWAKMVESTLDLQRGNWKKGIQDIAFGLKFDYGALKIENGAVGFMALVIRDMVFHAQAWAHLFNDKAQTRRLLRILGTKALHIYEEALAEIQNAPRLVRKRASHADGSRITLPRH